MALRECLDAPTDTLSGPLGGHAALAQIVAGAELLALCMFGLVVAVVLAC